MNMKMLKQIMEEFCDKELNLPVNIFSETKNGLHCVKFFGAEMRAFSSASGPVIFFSWEENDDGNEYLEYNKYVLAYSLYGEEITPIDYVVSENEKAANEFISDCQNGLYPFGELTPDYFSQEFIDYCNSFSK